MSDLLKSAETLNAMFWPRACAVLGASDNPSKIGGIPVRFFKEYGYEGDFGPINPTRDTVQGHARRPEHRGRRRSGRYGDYGAVPEALAIEAAEACARKGVKSLVTPTSGLAEAGEQGAANQQRRRTSPKKPAW